MTETLDEIGPIDYLVLEFPGNQFRGDVFPRLLDLVDGGLIRIIDLLFVRKEVDGEVVMLTVSDLDGDGELDLGVFEGASTGLIGEDDLDDVGGVIEPGSSAAVLIYENVWAVPFAAAVRASGGQLVSTGRIPLEEFLASLDETEADA
ncbi:DUF6325 family protein [Occultella gossypii]|uniref:DUF1269 domain-containing protein n=1 Tax=Occultella gossypii TaxID=2800820 RepID=A0ABS7S9E8_9MICO|nr:DUF6325 family protein [Occultella gossypii]MBZ2195863.1 DUF1269 domain-containing protein [Occultella gossypii]